MSSTRNALVCRNLSSLCSNSPGSIEFLDSLKSLDDISANLARDAAAREEIGRSYPDVWNGLCDIWNVLSARSIDILADDLMQRKWTLCIARFTRNLVAENPENQREALKLEPKIREVAHMYTSHFLIMNKEEFMTTRFLMQAISNLVTANEELLYQIWSIYTALPEEKNILIRMIAHPDDLTAAGALVFISNCLVGSRERMRMLIDASMGKRLCVAMLERLSRHVETSDEDENIDLFNVGWTIFKVLFENGFAPSLLNITTMEGVAVNPHQTILLKLLDSYLMQCSTSDKSEAQSTDNQSQGSVFSQISTLLLTRFLSLLHNAQSSIRRSLGRSSTADDDPEASRQIAKNAGTDSISHLHSLDVLLPKVCEATVLVVQCFCTMTLMQDARGNLSEGALRTKQYLNEASLNGAGVIESLIELLRLLDAFLPRIMFGRASWSTARPDPGSSAQIDKKEDRGFSYLKRDLVRLLGILCYENRAVQDRVRKCDGIAVVMNMCVMDERNPYLREHALFTLRNLLHNNVENQAAVDAIKPMGAWDGKGVLRDILGV